MNELKRLLYAVGTWWTGLVGGLVIMMIVLGGGQIPLVLGLQTAVLAIVPGLVLTAPVALRGCEVSPRITIWLVGAHFALVMAFLRLFRWFGELVLGLTWSAIFWLSSVTASVRASRSGG